MNILILTPDRVGSTLLQRLVTIYANAIDPNNLTVNLHELTNGIVKYHNEFYNRLLLGKKEKSWGYHQPLSQIVDILESVDHDKTSRLAHYHIKNRQDSLPDQLSFYEYLNDNFFIISARRQNLLEHALSWGISVESKKLNVYSFEEKYRVFRDIANKGIEIDENTLVKYLNQYAEYTNWGDSHFRVSAYFDYEIDLLNIENYILDLNPFRSMNRVTWEDQFDISWNDWNKMHYLLSLVPFQKEFTDEEKRFMQDHINLYTATRVKIQDFQDAGVLVTGIPIKLQTLGEKSKIVHNLEYCMNVYNNWITTYNPNFGITYNHNSLAQLAHSETACWNFGKADTMSALANTDLLKLKFQQSDLKND